MLKQVKSLNALRTFEVCARLESVQETADALHVTPSAVSHQLRKLEQEIGVELFTRSHRKITPTEKGRVLQKEVMKSFEQIALAIDDLREDDRRELVINVLPVFSIRWLNPRLLNFFNAHPEIDLTIRNSYRVEDLSKQKCDVAIRWGDGDWPGVRSSKLFDEYVIPSLSPRLAESSNVVNEESLLDLPLIQTFDGANHWEQWATLNGYETKKKRKYIRFNDPSAALQAAIDGLGVVLGPISLLHTEFQTGRLIAPFGKPLNANKAYYLVMPKGEERVHDKLEKFIAWVQDETKRFESELRASYRFD